MKVALINNNTVSQIVDIEDTEFQHYCTQNESVVDITDMFPVPQVGWTFDGVRLSNPTGPYSKITKLALRQRFTLAEMAAVQTAAKTNIIIEVLLDNVKVATFIDLKRQDTIEGLMYLVSIGILTLERANIILSTEPTEIEIYRGEY